MAKVSKRGGFSDRNAIKPINMEVQLTEFDQRTRIQLLNMINELYRWVYGGDLYYRRIYIQDFIRFVRYIRNLLIIELIMMTMIYLK